MHVGRDGPRQEGRSARADAAHPGAIVPHLDLRQPRRLQEVALVAQGEARPTEAVALAAHLVQRRQQQAGVEGEPPGKGAGLAGRAQHGRQPQRQRGAAWQGQRPLARRWVKPTPRRRGARARA